MKLSHILAIAIMVSASGVAAADEDQAASEQEKVICKTEKVTGSRTRTKRTCMTQKQWDQLAARTKEGMEEMQRSASGGTAVSNSPGPGGPGGL